MPQTITSPVYKLGDLLGMALRGEITPQQAQDMAQERVEQISTDRASKSESPNV